MPDSTDPTREPGSEPEPSPEPSPAPIERRRIPLRAQVVAGVLLAALGFAAITQVRSTSADDTYSGRREQDLVLLLGGLAGARERAQTDIAALERTKGQLESSSSKRQAALQEARTEIATLDILAGRVPVVGPGLQLTITDPQGTVDSDVLLDAVQELRTAGAEAMSFNGRVRVVAQTSFEDTAGGIIVGGTTLSAPFVIDVIGEPTELKGALTFPGGPDDLVRADGGTLTATASDRLRIDATVTS